LKITLEKSTYAVDELMKKENWMKYAYLKKETEYMTYWMCLWQMEYGSLAC